MEPGFLPSFDLDVPREGAYLAAGLVAVAAAIAIRSRWRRGPLLTRIPRIAAIALVGGFTAIYIARHSDDADAGTCLAGLIATGIILRHLARPLGAAVPQPTRLAVGALRALAVVLIFALLSRPTFRWQRLQNDSPVIAIAIDHSRSMAIRDVPADRAGDFVPRFEAVQDMLTKCRNVLGELERRFTIRRYAFSAEGHAPGTKPDGARTALAAGLLADLAASGTPRPPAVVIIVSDGENNLDQPTNPLAAARQLTAGGTAIFTVGVGSDQPTGQTRSILPLELTAPSRVTLDTRFPVEAFIEFRGFADESMLIRLFWDDVEAARTLVRPIAVRQTERIRLPIMARPAGPHRLTVAATTLAPTPSVRPATLTRCVFVVGEVLRILSIESLPRHESAFIARALTSESRFNIRRVLLAPPVEGDWSNPLPRDANGYREYDVVMLGDVTAPEVGPRSLTALARAVADHGTGLVVLGGDHLAADASLFDSPLRDALPIGPPRTAPSPTPTAIIPTPAGLRHAIVQSLADTPDDTSAVARTWQALPPSRISSRFGPPKPTAEVLAKSTDGQPRIIAASVGQGRALVIAFDDSWRWCMQHDEGLAAHRRFWRQVALWTANRRPQINVQTDRDRYDLARLRTGDQTIEVEAVVLHGLTGTTLGEISVHAERIAPDGARSTLPLARGDESWRATTTADAAGEHRIRLDVRSGGAVIGSAETRFLVEDRDVEMIEQLANLDLLRRIAAVSAGTGGGFTTLGGLPDLLEKIRADHVVAPRYETRSLDVSDVLGWPLLVAMVMLLSMEWMIRKRAGLV